MKKILIIAPQYVGDSILVIPFLRELRKHYNNDIIDVVTKNAGKLVLSECPYINNIYLEKDLKTNFYDKAYVLKRSLSSALLCKKLKIKDTIGFGGQFREFFIKKIIKYKAFEKHECDHFMDVLKAEGITISDNNLEYYIDKTAKQNIQKYFSDKKRALIVTSSSTTVKNWTEEGFNKIIEHLNNNGYECFIVGLEKEKEYNNKFKNAKNLCGELSFKEITALIAEMDLVFGVDSGFCHIASAFNKKTVALFGSTCQTQWALKDINSHTLSLNLKCSPCKKAKKCKKGFECMQKISADFVINFFNENNIL